MIIKLRGRVISGLKKGSYYVMLEPYRSFFRSLLGSDPFPGTLNIHVPDISNPAKFLRRKFVPSINGRSSVLYAEGRLSGIKVLVIRPEKSTHPENVLEIVAVECLRKILRLKDGDFVEVEIWV